MWQTVLVSATLDAKVKQLASRYRIRIAANAPAVLLVCMYRGSARLAEPLLTARLRAILLRLARPASFLSAVHSKADAAGGVCQLGACLSTGCARVGVYVDVLAKCACVHMCTCAL